MAVVVQGFNAILSSLLPLTASGEFSKGEYAIFFKAKRLFADFKGGS